LFSRKQGIGICPDSFFVPAWGVVIQSGRPCSKRKIMADLEIYARQGLGQTAGLGQRVALLLVDFVVGFNDPAHFGGGNIAGAIGATARLLPTARGLGWPIAHTRLVYAADGSDAGAFTLKAPGLLKLTEESPLSQFVAEVGPAAGELVIRKRQASAFFCTELAGWLEARRHAAGRRLHDVGMRARERR
jgi:maleamate amidohydrolase